MSNDAQQVGVKELITRVDLDMSRLYIEYQNGSSLVHDFDIIAEEFLEFAERDILNIGKYGLVNALSNAKRAIDCQVDKVLCCFGLSTRKNFPQKRIHYEIWE